MLYFHSLRPFQLCVFDRNAVPDLPHFLVRFVRPVSHELLVECGDQPGERMSDEREREVFAPRDVQGEILWDGEEVVLHAAPAQVLQHAQFVVEGEDVAPVAT